MDESIGDKPTETDGLEWLARAYVGDQTPRSRPETLRRLLDAALTAYEAGSPAEATAIRGLFFDSSGRTPGPAGVSQLRDIVMRANSLPDERAFGSRRRTWFRVFAGFLVEFVLKDPKSAFATAEAATASASVSIKPARRSRRTVYLLVGAAAGVVALAIGIIVAVTHSGAGNRRSTSPSGIQVHSTSSIPIMFRFDTHGESPFYVYVYPGPLATSADRVTNGTYPDQEEVAAVCEAVGRTVTFAPDGGGTGMASNQWVQVDGGVHRTQFATLAFGELVPASATLRTCSGVT